MFLLEQVAYSAAHTVLKGISSTHVAIDAVLDGIVEGKV